MVNYLIAVVMWYACWCSASDTSVAWIPAHPKFGNAVRVYAQVLRTQRHASHVYVSEGSCPLYPPLSDSSNLYPPLCDSGNMASHCGLETSENILEELELLEDGSQG